MQTTSSPTSATPSSDYKAVPFFGWSLLAVLFIAGSFLSREISTEDTKNIFYDYGFAVTTIVWYAALVGLPAAAGAMAGAAIQQRISARALSFAFAGLLATLAVWLLLG